MSARWTPTGQRRVFDSLLVWFLAALVVAGATFVQSCSGFGFALVAAPLLAMLAPDLIPMVLVIASLPTLLWVIWRDGAGIARRDFVALGLGVAPGSLAGLWLLGRMDVTWLSLLIALSVLAAILASFGGFRIPVRPATETAMGFISGAGGALMGISGPPLVILYQDADRDRFRATLSVAFLVGNAITICGYALVGRLGGDVLPRIGLLVPATLVGLWLSHGLAKRVERGRVRAFGLGLAAASSVILLVRTLARLAG